MFRVARTLHGTLAHQPRFVRNWGNVPTRFPKSREENYLKKHWLDDPAAYPIIVVMIGAISLGAFKCLHDLGSPEAHFGKEERGTMDYLENKRKPFHTNSRYLSHRDCAAKKA
jgi:hypothetical protein